MKIPFDFVGVRACHRRDQRNESPMRQHRGRSNNSGCIVLKAILAARASISSYQQVRREREKFEPIFKRIALKKHLLLWWSLPTTTSVSTHFYRSFRFALSIVGTPPPGS
jgi:hypothetical protein